MLTTITVVSPAVIFTIMIVTVALVNSYIKVDNNEKCSYWHTASYVATH